MRLIYKILMLVLALISLIHLASSLAQPPVDFDSTVFSHKDVDYHSDLIENQEANTMDLSAKIQSVSNTTDYFVQKDEFDAPPYSSRNVYINPTDCTDEEKYELSRFKFYKLENICDNFDRDVEFELTMRGDSLCILACDDENKTSNANYDGDCYSFDKGSPNYNLGDGFSNENSKKYTENEINFNHLHCVVDDSYFDRKGRVVKTEKIVKSKFIDGENVKLIGKCINVDNKNPDRRTVKFSIEKNGRIYYDYEFNKLPTIIQTMLDLLNNNEEYRAEIFKGLKNISFCFKRNKRNVFDNLIVEYPDSVAIMENHKMRNLYLKKELVEAKYYVESDGTIDWYLIDRKSLFHHESVKLKSMTVLNINFNHANELKSKFEVPPKIPLKYVHFDTINLLRYYLKSEDKSFNLYKDIIDEMIPRYNALKVELENIFDEQEKFICKLSRDLNKEVYGNGLPECLETDRVKEFMRDISENFYYPDFSVNYLPGNKIYTSIPRENIKDSLCRTQNIVHYDEKITAMLKIFDIYNKKLSNLFEALEKERNFFRKI